MRPVPVGNRSTTLDHQIRSPTVPKTTTRGACFRGKLYEGVCELNRKNAVTQDILSQRNLFSVVTNLYILSLIKDAQLPIQKVKLDQLLYSTLTQSFLS